MKWIEVSQSGPLNGTIKIPGSKNSALALLTAACMGEEPVRLQSIPDLHDIRVIEHIFSDIGIGLRRESNGDMLIDARQITTADLDPLKTSTFRASYYFIGALLAKQKRVKIGYPGGDDFVSRPIDQHFKVFKAFGASIQLFDTYYMISADHLIGADIYFDVITSGATINALLVAVLASGESILRNAATDPEVVDTANMLNQMGAQITGAGTSTIRVKGVRQLGGCTYAVIPDRLIAGAFLAAAGATQGNITVDGIIPAHLSSFVAKLEEIGIGIETKEQRITAYGGNPLKATRIRTAMYPGFATDLQQPLTPVLLRAPGKSIITEKVYPKRFNHVQQLNRMGANIKIRGASAFIQGNTRLRGEIVHATDVRAGVCLLLAGFIAEGTTRITGVEHIDRGYADVVAAFRSLGGKIRHLHGNILENESGLELQRSTGISK